jgi:hypothetical protein
MQARRTPREFRPGSSASRKDGKVPLEPNLTSVEGWVTGVNPNVVLTLRALTYLEEGEEVTVGCAESGSYAVLPADGAALLRQIESGMTLDDAARWYLRAYGESVDLAEFVSGLHDLGWIRLPGERAAARVAPLRGMRLGRAVFSPLGGFLFAAVITAWVVVAIRFRQLAPANHDLFFTRYVSVVALVSLATQVPLLLLHEAFHVLAGRRLGLRTRLSVDRRLYYIVFQTEMDGLVSVPRGRRYLPIMAGIICDLSVAGVLTLIAATTMGADGQLPLAGRIALAIAYTTLLRVGWQFLVYLRTDLYYLVTTITGCVDLNSAARAVLRNRLSRLTGRTRHLTDLSAWHPKDRSAARWYSWLLLAGWAYSLASLPIVVAPILIRMVVTIGRSLAGPGTRTASGVVDSSVSFLIIALQVVGLAWLGYRERRRSSSRPHVLP